MALTRRGFLGRAVAAAVLPVGFIRLQETYNPVQPENKLLQPSRPGDYYVQLSMEVRNERKPDFFEHHRANVFVKILYGSNVIDERWHQIEASSTQFIYMQQIVHVGDTLEEIGFQVRSEERDLIVGNVTMDLMRLA